MKRLATGLAVVALALAGNAYAQRHDKWFNPDSNGDGVVTRDEAKAQASAMFARMDANHDGKLDQVDREAHRQQMRTMMFDRLDANHDGSISRDEFMAFQGPGQDSHGMRGPMAMGDHKGMRGHRDMMMKRADTNNDGVISKDEFLAAADKRFDSIDANHDGKITQEERQAHREQMREQWRGRTDG